MPGVIWTIIKLKVSVIAVAAVGLLVAGWLRLRREHATWGLVTADLTRTLAGDDLVSDADTVETRSLDIAAPPSAVWPWLVQMGYGRGGWYSYDQLDMRGPSARTIDPELQDLAEGDTRADPSRWRVHRARRRRPARAGAVSRRGDRTGAAGERVAGGHDDRRDAGATPDGGLDG